jgi:hypothetical protein
MLSSVILTFIIPKGACALEDCLGMFTEIDKISDAACPKCSVLSDIERLQKSLVRLLKSPKVTPETKLESIKKRITDLQRVLEEDVSNVLVMEVLVLLVQCVMCKEQDNATLNIPRVLSKDMRKQLMIARVTFLELVTVFTQYSVGTQAAMFSYQQNRIPPEWLLGQKQHKSLLS